MTKKLSKIKEKKYHFNVLYEGSIDAIVFLNKKEVLDCNQATLKLFGFSRKKDFLKLHPLDLSPKKQPNGKLSRTEANKKIEEAFKKGENKFEWVHFNKKGKEFFAEVLLTAFTFENKKFLQASVRDISKTKKSLEQLQTRLTAIDAAADMIVITDIDGFIEYANPAFTKTTGYSFKEAIGKSTNLLRSDRQNKDFYKNLWQTVLSKKVWAGKMVNRRKDGSFYPEEMTVTPVISPEGDIVRFVAIKRDITEKVQAEQELSREMRKSLELEKQLAQSQKMESIGTLAGGVAHDFNNQLTAIIGYSELILDELEQDDTKRQEIEGIIKAAQRSAALTRQLLAFSRKEMIHPTNLNLNKLIVNLDKMLKRLIHEDIEFKFIPSKNLGDVFIDPAQAKNILANLVVNATQAISGKGKILIETKNTVLEQSQVIGYENVASGEYVMLSVSDTGCGMTSKIMEQIFEPFFTTKEKEKGTGLGLSTCFGIVQQNKGYIHPYSEPEKGTIIKVYLPRIKTNKKQTASQNKKPKNLKGNETILVVEDEVAVRDVAIKNLIKQGYRILEASNGIEALKILNEQNKSIDLIFTDMVMPDMGGIELSKKVKKLYPNIKILFASGYSDQALNEESDFKKKAAFIQKPYSSNNVISKIREELDRQDKAVS